MSTDQATTRSAVQQLAECYGISSQFENAFGERVTVHTDTMLLLLASMGINVTSEEEARNCLAQTNQLLAGQQLPASIIVVPEDGISKVILKGVKLRGPLEWHVALENGDQIEGSFSAELASPDRGDVVTLAMHHLPFGYHTLRLPQLNATSHLIVSPGKCWLPESKGQGHWGIAVQLYLVRSARNWGMGDFSDLCALIEMAGQRGCGFMGLNPLHQMFLDSPGSASPYSPATRLFLNPLYIDVEAVPEWTQSQSARELAGSSQFQEQLARCRAAKLVDYAAVTALKLKALRHVYQTFAEHAAPERKQALEVFRAEKGPSLTSASLFQALRQHFAQSSPDEVDWRHWQKDYRTLGTDALQDFAKEHKAELDFQDWLQFIADEQLANAADAARRQSMSIGLYRDLAVGCDAAGAEVWSKPTAFLQGVLVGAPPDIFNPSGQNWGLPPLNPLELARNGYQSFVELIRANMRQAGGVRIDHVMGLQRLFCIPEGRGPADGAYINFPLDDLIDVLALESQRNQCLVVGEDLGTVQGGFRERMATANILSYRVLFFEQDFDTATFAPPDAYPALALATTGSHDLPTLLAWWRGDDLALKLSLGAFDSPQACQSQQARRERERRNILAAFTRAGLDPQMSVPSAVSAETFAQLAHEYLGMTKSLLLATQLDDMTGEVEPVNVPGTADEHPNWRRKYRLTLEELENDTEAWNLTVPLARRIA